jgi:class 3 adenylate cyclase
MDATLERFARHVEEVQWAGLVLDDDWRLRWVSSELKEFLGEHDDERLGCGRHVAEAFLSPPWLDVVHPDSQPTLLTHMAPYVAERLASEGRDVADTVPDQFRPLLDGLEPAPAPPVWSAAFLYVNPRDEPDAAPYVVDVLVFRLARSDGGAAGWGAICMMAVRPTLLALLGRGDQRMYERMARLVHPGRREAAILFCDLHGSGVLSRRLPSAEYFRLIRRLWTAIDRVVADNGGIVGKHAGDGATAFFLVEDLGGASGAAAAAVASARRIHDLSVEVFADVTDSDCLMQVGVHWGASLYIGQLVPGGRLDVTALGDEVNEAARVQEAAGPHETLATKHLLERLSAEDAKALGIDTAHVSYRLLAEVAPDRDKVVRDAGPLPVTPV